MVVKKFICDTSEIRIDLFLSKQIKEFSRNALTELIKTNKVLCNGTPCKPSLKLQVGDKVEITLPEINETEITPQNIPLDILYEDQWMAIINKEKGIVVHPAPGHSEGTLVNGLLYHFKEELSDINGIQRPGIVHRIDKDTSGLLMIIKDNKTHEIMAKEIAKHKVIRTYRAVVHGVIPENSAKIDLPIGRDPDDRVKYAVIKDGKKAITHFKVLKRYKNYTYIELQLETGRTHQIRVHMAYLGFPILGDKVYGSRGRDIPAFGQTLHAFELEFIHPLLNRDIIVQAPLPLYFMDILNLLEKKK